MDVPECILEMYFGNLLSVIAIMEHMNANIVNIMNFIDKNNNLKVLRLGERNQSSIGSTECIT